MLTQDIDSSGILKLLKGLDPHKACGPDNLPTYILKECAEDLAALLANIYNQSLEEGQLPQDWLAAICLYFVGLFLVRNLLNNIKQ